MNQSSQTCRQGHRERQDIDHDDDRLKNRPVEKTERGVEDDGERRRRIVQGPPQDIGILARPEQTAVSQVLGEIA